MKVQSLDRTFDILELLSHEPQGLNLTDISRNVELHKSTVYRLLSSLAARAKGIVVVSSDLRELMAICDRIVVMSAGRLAASFDRDEWSEDKIMSAAISGYVERAEEPNID